jgi:FeS assembly protein IscX
MDDLLSWEDSFAIARALIEKYPGINLEDVSLNMIFEWTVALPGFDDEPDLANDGILAAIYQEWYEEVDSI